ncbi:hypothetical protein RRG08_003162 [Elysia crispata]|uniref:Uncharacterized protein n=1 Tax=Elysia crispata TaxID=231223 RepID=A0AAE1ECC2_9GAST|nr:hypothetical protein RRG08_003162 [Elysia crispata]
MVCTDQITQPRKSRKSRDTGGDTESPSPWNVVKSKPAGKQNKQVSNLADKIVGAAKICPRKSHGCDLGIPGHHRSNHGLVDRFPAPAG